jgi:predicted TIM-barrel fold metal-dependent hydrolase
MEKIDIACHVGYDPLMEIGVDLDDLLLTLDDHNVRYAVLKPIGEGLIHKFSEQNRRLADIASEHQRFLFFCSANPWFGRDALDELEWCFAELNASGVSFDTARQGLYIDSPMIFPFIDLCQHYTKPVYFFTGMPIFALPLNLANLARQYPNVRFIMGALGVSDYWGDIIPAVRLASNLYIETSVNTNVPAVLKSFVDEFGDEKVLYGSNFPFTDYEMEYRKIELAGLSDGSLEKIFFTNAANLLEIVT